MAINVADLFLTLRASQEQLLPDLRAARGNVAAAAADMGLLLQTAFGAALGTVGRLFRSVPGGMLAPLATALETAVALTAGGFRFIWDAANRVGAGVAVALGGAVTAVGGAVTLAAGLGVGAVLGVTRGLIAAAAPAGAAVASLFRGTAELAIGLGVGIVKTLGGLGAILAGAFGTSLAGVGRFIAGAATGLGLILAAGITTGLFRAATLAVGAGAAIASGLGTAFRAVVGSLPGWLTAGAGALAGAAATVAGYVGAGVSKAVSLVGRVGGAIGGPLLAGLGMIKSGLTYAFGGIVEGVKGALSAVMNLGQAVVGLVSGIISGFLSMGSFILAGVVGIVSGIGTVISGALSAVTGLFGAVAKAAGEFLGGAVGAAAGIAEKAISLLARTVGAVLGPALSALSSDLTDWGKWVAGAMQAQVVMAKMGSMLHASGEAAGWSAGQLDVMAKSLEQLGGHSLEEIKQAQLVLLRFGEVRGTQFSGALAGARQLAAVLGQDLPSAAQMLGRALESPEHAARMLRQAGLNLTPLEHEMLKAFMASGQLTKAQDLLLAKVARLGDVAGAQADTLAGRVNKLKLTWDSVGRAVGEALLPWATIVVDFLQPAIEGFAETLRGALGGAAEAGKSTLEQVRGWVADNRTALVTWGQQAAAIVLEMVSRVRELFAWMAKGASWALDTITGGSGVTADDITEAFSRALAGIRTLFDNIPTLWNATAVAVELGGAELWRLLRIQATAFFDWLGKQAVAGTRTLLEKLPGWLRGEGFGGAGTQQRLIRGCSRADQAKEEEKHINALHDRLKKIKDELKAKFEVDLDTVKAEQHMADLLAKRKKIRDAINAPDMTPTPTPVQNMVIKYSFVNASEFGKELQKSITGSAMQDERNDRKETVNQLKEGNKIAGEQLGVNKQALQALNDLLKGLPGGLGFAD